MRLANQLKNVCPKVSMRWGRELAPLASPSSFLALKV